MFRPTLGKKNGTENNIFNDFWVIEWCHG